MFLSEHYPEVINKRYSTNIINKTEDIREASEVLREIAINRNYLLKGSEPDVNKVAEILMDEFRNGKLGRITLEFSESINE